MWRLSNELRIYLGEFQVKAFSKVLLTGALALGGLTVMNIETPKHMLTQQASSVVIFVVLAKRWTVLQFKYTPQSTATAKIWLQKSQMIELKMCAIV